MGVPGAEAGTEGPVVGEGERLGEVPPRRGKGVVGGGTKLLVRGKVKSGGMRDEN